MICYSPSARMCIGDSRTQYQPPLEVPPPPIVPAASLVLPSGTEITSEGMPPSLDKDKLDELLHAASQSSCLDARCVSVFLFFYFIFFSNCYFLLHSTVAFCCSTHILWNACGNI